MKWIAAAKRRPTVWSGWILVCFDPANHPNGTETQSVGYIDKCGDYVDLVGGGPVGQSIAYWMPFPECPAKMLQAKRAVRTVNAMLRDSGIDPKALAKSIRDSI